MTSKPRVLRPARRTLPRLRQVCGFLIIAAIAGSTIAQQSAAAAAKTYEPAFSLLRDEMSYDVQTDATYTFEKFQSVRLNNDQGVKQNSQVPLRYSTSMQELEVLEAYTTTRDGKRIDVAADKIMLQQSPQSAGAPMFDDAKVKTVIFPATGIGPVLTLHWRTTLKEQK